MNINLRAAIAALALVSTAPASAALVTYNFTAGGDGGYSFGLTNTSSCISGTCTYNYLQDSEAFTLSGSFTVDTSKLPADTYDGPDGLSYNSYPNRDPAVQFLSGTMTKTGGSLALGTGTGGALSYLYANDTQGGGGSSTFQAYAHGPGSTDGYIYEYRENGSLARVYFREDYIAFSVNNSLPDLSSIDGHDMAATFNDALGEAMMGFIRYEYFYDDFGNLADYTESSEFAQAAITSLNAAPDGPTEVPEPAMLGLFGLGIAGLAMGRRRKAA
ncbi:MAG: PEP-CTERM sorting domain-containing protein [Sphingomonadaceae bacterium]|nr:PEP-CTERM sorting domain-containing protein [Sphingomonadaceae bacterium]